MQNQGSGVQAFEPDKGPSDIVAFLDKHLHNNRNFVIAALLAGVLQLVLIVTHVHCLDEWQAAQIAADSPSFSALLENLRYEGHPPLWYLLLQGALFVVPFQWALKAVLIPIAAITQSLILFRAPFTRAERLLLSTGVLMMFEYLTISRSLSLGVMTLVIMMSFWRHRTAPWIAIAVLPMCDFLFGVLSCIAVLGRWRDKSIWWPGVILWLASGLISAWTVLPAPDMVPALPAEPVSGFFGTLNNLGTMLVPLQADGFRLTWNSPLPFNLGMVLCPLFLWMGYRLTKNDTPSLIAFFGFTLLIFIFSMTIYTLLFRHASLVALLLILLQWRLVLRSGKSPDSWFRCWLLVGGMCGLVVAGHALTMPFNSAPAVVQWIKAKGLEDKRWLVFPDSRAQSVSALSGIDFERVDQGCRISFVRWNQKKPIESRAELESKLRENAAVRGQAYMLAQRPMSDMPRDLVKRIAYFPAAYDGQDYYLFLISPNSPEKAERAPYCVSTMRR